MVGGVEEFDRSGIGQKNVAADRKGRPITPGSDLALQRCEQRSFVRASALQESLLDLSRRAGDVRSDQRISLTRQAGDTEDTLEAAGVRIDDRMAVAAEAVQLRDEMLVAADGYRMTQFVGGGDRVGAGSLLAKSSAVQLRSQQFEHASHARAAPTRRDDAGVAVGEHDAVVPAVERCGHRVQDRVGGA